VDGGRGDYILLLGTPRELILVSQVYDYPIIPVENTKQIHGTAFIGVQAATDAEAEKSLELIAKRRGVTVDKVYRWGTGYYYAPIAKTD
jgi:hypothetical protein